MADSNADGRIKIWSVPSISNRAAPTVAELNAGMALDLYMTPDGLVGFEPDTGGVDNSKINSTFDTTTPGRAAFSGTLLRFHKQEPTDTVYNTLVYAYVTNIVVRRDITSSTAWQASQVVEVYPVACGHPRNLPAEKNATHKYEILTMITSEPNLRATTA